MPAMTQQQQNALQPFRLNARRRWYPTEGGTIQLGSQSVMRLREVGYLVGLYLTVKAVATFSAPGVLADFGPFNLLSRVELAINTGTQNIVRVSGYELFYANWMMLRAAFFPGATDLAFAPTAAGPNNWTWTLYVPATMNDGHQFDIGLIALQTTDTRMTLEIQYTGSPTDVATNCTSITGTVQAVQVGYEIPDLRYVLPPEQYLHRIVSERKVIDADGDYEYNVPRGGDLLQLAQIHTLNGRLSDLRLGTGLPVAILGGRMEINISDKLLVWTADAMRYDIAMHHGAGGINAATWSVGTGVLYNFMGSGPTGTGEGDSRDWVQTDAAATVRTFTTLAPGSVAGAQNFQDSIRRLFQPLV